jgi:general secretion pathway protein B
MSFILDALKKSETDRQRQASPALFEVKVAAPRRGFPVWAAGLVVGLLAIILVLAWLLLRQPDATLTETAAAPAAAAPAASTAGAAANTAPPGMMTVQIPISASPSVTVGNAANTTPADGSGVTPPPANEPVLEGHEPAVPPDYDAGDYRPAITPAQAGAIAAARRNGELPSRDEVIAQGSQLPDLRLDLLVYATNPHDRFVFINMRKLREGDTLPEGVRVEQITSTGAELSYRGKRFTLNGN